MTDEKNAYRYAPLNYVGGIKRSKVGLLILFKPKKKFNNDVIKKEETNDNNE